MDALLFPAFKRGELNGGNRFKIRNCMTLRREMAIQQSRLSVVISY